MVELVWFQDDAEARMKAGESLVDLMAPMTSTVASMVASWVAPFEASMEASMASVASMASMVEALDWLKRMTAESKSDGERADGWTHKIREELTDGLTCLDGVVQVVTWARTNGVESLVDSMALMARIASTVASMVASMVAAMVASMASMASMVASRASVVAAMASMASMVVPLEWLNLIVAKPKEVMNELMG